MANVSLLRSHELNDDVCAMSHRENHLPNDSKGTFAKKWLLLSTRLSSSSVDNATQ